MIKKYISAKEVVDKYGISYSSLNYYTNLGLFKVKKRSGNARLYDTDEVKKTRGRINKLANMGYPLRIIRKMIKAV
ncbi:MAG: MerR family transcriptional regulator [Candidatus Omnitrophota bacterium]